MPNRAMAARTNVKPLIILATTANNTPIDGAGFDTTLKKNEAVAFEVGIVGGTQGTVNLTFQESNTTDVNASYSTIALANLEFQRGVVAANPFALTFAGATPLSFMLVVGYAGSARFIRAILSGVAGTPNFPIYVGVVASRMRHIGGV